MQQYTLSQSVKTLEKLFENRRRGSEKNRRKRSGRNGDKNRK